MSMEYLETKRIILEKTINLSKDLVSNFICKESDLEHRQSRHGTMLIEWTHEDYYDADTYYEIEVIPSKYIVRTNYLSIRNYVVFEEEHEVIEYLKESIGEA